VIVINRSDVVRQAHNVPCAKEKSMTIPATSRRRGRSLAAAVLALGLIGSAMTGIAPASATPEQANANGRCPSVISSLRGDHAAITVKNPCGNKVLLVYIAALNNPMPHNVTSAISVSLTPGQSYTWNAGFYITSYRVDPR